MSIKTKLALAIALVLSSSSAVFAAPRHNAHQAQIPAAEQSWMDRASNSDGAFN
jgi:FlaG/FlaF family flagellin (archaellin)